MPSLSQLLARLRKASRQFRPTSLGVPPLTLRRVTWQRISFSEPLVCSGVEPRSGSTGRSSTISNSALLACNRASRRSSGERCDRTGREGQRLALGWFELISLEAGIEVPDPAADPRLRGPVLVGE